MSSNFHSSIRCLPMARSLALSVCCFAVTITMEFPASGKEAAVDRELKDRLMSATEHLESLSRLTSGRASILVLESHPRYDLPDGRVLPAIHDETLNKISVAGNQLVKKVTIENGVETLQVANSEYAFMLTRPEGEGGSYSISGVGKIGVSQSDDKMLDEAHAESRAYLFTPYYFLGRPVWELIRDPGFTWIGIESCGDGKDERVRVDFSYYPQTVSNNTFKDVVIKKGYMIFAANDDWKMVEYERDGDRKPIEAFDDSPTDQLAFTKFCGVKTFKDDGTMLAANYWTTQEHSYDPVPKEEFYMSFYGFPEPEFGGNQYWSWIVVSMVLGGGCLIAARQLLKRSSKS